MTSVIPSSEIVSSVSPSIFMTKIATPSDAGIAISTTIALRHERRKNSITIPVSATPSSSVRMTPSSCCSAVPRLDVDDVEVDLGELRP